MDYKIINQYLDKQKIKVVETYDFESKKVKYSEKIKGWKIDKFRGDEEIVRAFVLAKLVNELGYKPENIELEKQYDIGRPKVNKPRIDIIIRDDKGDAFLYIELKSPQDYEKDKDEVIEKQLFNLASQEKGQGNNVKYLVLYTFEPNESEIKDKCILIDYEKFTSFDSWKEVRNFADELPERYGKAQKEPYIKNGKKYLETSFTHEKLDGLRKNLHNVLWGGGGGGIDDNDIFSSLVNIILAKIQDESERKNGEKYEFQVFTYKDGENFESNEELYDRINKLYKRALENRLTITNKEELSESFVIDRKKFSLSKLKYTVSELEKFSFTQGNKLKDGKDILGEFFENIVSNGFKQSKGQFFTHINVVKFLLWGLQLDKLAVDLINKQQDLPYFIDPSAGSGSFLIEYMKFITQNIKHRFKEKIDDSLNIKKFVGQCFPDEQENMWAEKYIYGSEINPNLGTAIKVNMILHGDGSANIFVGSNKGDGLSKFSKYVKQDSLSILTNTKEDNTYPKDVNECFDVIITNPPFSITLDDETQRNLNNTFLFGDKKNSENLFIERWYQLLKPNGRLGVVLPESVFDTTENKYIRLFIYKYFKVKAVVSLPQLTFEPFTSTKTSLLFAQKKTKDEIDKWNNLWSKYSNEWSHLKTRCENLLDVYLGEKDRKKLPSIKDLTEKEEKEILKRMLKDYIEEDDQILSSKELVEKYKDELGYSNSSLLKEIKKYIPNYIKIYINGKNKNQYKYIKNQTDESIKNNLLKYFDIKDENNIYTIKNILIENDYNKINIPDERKNGLIYYDNDTKEVFGFVNTWWVFGEVAKELNYKIFMAEVGNIGYKRKERGEKPMPNELYREGEIIYQDGKKHIVILVDDGVKETALDYLRDVLWD